jgi:hypothetical protein
MYGLTELLNGEWFLPADRAFFSQQICKLASPSVEFFLRRSEFVRYIDNVGVYFRRTPVTEYGWIVTETEIEELTKIRHALKTYLA